MNRRNLLKFSGAALALNGAASTRLWAAPANYTGEFLIQVQVGGAWDVASYCDPKMNVGDKILNNWATSDTIKRAGNINYAPFSNNAELFEAHYDKMLVINGVNCYTNGHSAGRRYNFTGSTQAGYPNLSAAFAATLQEDFPMPLLVNGGQFESGNIIVPTRVGKDINTFNTLLEPNLTVDNKTNISPEDLSAIDSFRNQRATDALSKARINANHEFLENFLVANKAFPNFAEFKRVLESVDTTGFDMNENLNQQMLYALVGFKSGVSVAADTHLTGFDTHSDHDNLHAPRIEKLNNAILLAWEVADQLGIKDRLNMFVASDFARTPNYNDSGGKDHWPVGSVIFMKDNVNWTNRVVGGTDEMQIAHNLDPNTLQPDPGGIILEPNYIMDWARRIMGIDQHELMRNFDLRTGGVSLDFSRV